MIHWANILLDIGVVNGSALLIRNKIIKVHKKVAAIGFEPTTKEKVNRNVAQVLGVESEKNINREE